VTTIVPFVPSATSVFSFQATLDGDPYNATVTWSLFGQRYYINLAASDGTTILTTALVGSPPPLQLIGLSWADGLVTAMTGAVVTVAIPGTGPGAFTATAAPFTATAGVSGYADYDLELKITAGVSHGLRVGSVVPLTIAGALPDAYNGLVDALITGPVSFTYALANDPGVATSFGRASYDLNLVGGVQDVNGNYFSSSLVFRQAAMQFEITP